MEGKITIRKADLKDLPRIQELYKRLFMLEHRQYDETLLPSFAFTKAGRQYLMHRIKSEQMGFVVVALHNGKIVGYACGGKRAYENFRIRKKYAELENMFIEPRYRNHGLGRAFLSGFLAWAKTKKYHYALIAMSAKNEHARALYHRLGFSESELHLIRKIK